MIHTLYSGGAQGADTIFAMCAKDRGDEVYHFSFPGHKCSNVGGIIILDEGDLNKYTEELVLAGKVLGKSYARKAPEHARFKYIRNLLARNAWQVFGSDKGTFKPSEAVYAVGNLGINKLIVEGGTGWAVALACHQTDIPIHVFDLKSNVWHIWVEDKFHPAQEPSPPSGTYTGIGSRKLTDAGIEAIGKLYGIEEMMK